MHSFVVRTAPRASSTLVALRWIGLWAVLSLLGGTQSTSAATVALFSTREAGQVVVDLAGVELSQREWVELLDRSRIEQVLAEQKLTAFGEKSDPLLLGQLLGVEMFIVWDQPAADPAGRLIVFDGATGVRLADRHIAEKDVTLIAQAVATNIDAAQKKQQQIRDAQLRLISLTSIRNVNLPPQLQERANQFLSQLEQSITQHPTCGLLERARLRYVVREQSLPIAQKQAHLLAAARTVTVELLQSGAKQFAVKLLVHEAGRAQPLAIEEKLLFDGSVEDTQATATLAEKLSQIQVDQARRLSKEQHRQFEIDRLMREGSRLLSTGHGLEAASRFEAAYALGEVNLSLNMLSISLRHYAQALSQNHWEYHAIPAPLDKLKPVPPERWFEVAELAHYRIDLLDRMHENSMQEARWPFMKSALPGPDRLATGIDELRLLIPPNAVLLVHPEKLPTQYNALQKAYLRGYDQLFQKFAGDARRQLRGEDLLRLNQQVSANQLTHLADPIAQHLLPNWADRFVEVFTENLQHELWLRDATAVAARVPDLPVPQRELLLSRLDTCDRERCPAGCLAVQYIRLRTQQRGRQKPSSEFDTLCIHLVEQFAEEYAKPDASVHDMVQVGTAGVPIINMSSRRATLGHLIDATLRLVSDQTLAQSTREVVFLGLLQKEVFPIQFLAGITTPKSIPPSVKTLEQAIEIVESKELSDQPPWKELTVLLRKSQKGAQALMPNLPSAARHLSLPWQRVQEVSLSEAGRRPTRIHYTGIYKEHLYIVSSRDYGGRDAIVLQIHRQPLTANTPSVRITEEEFSRQTIDAGTQQVALLRQCPIHFSGFFTLLHSDAVLGLSNEYLVMPTVADGLYVFPIGGGASRRFGTDEGLPSNYVQCAMPVGDKVFAWVGLTGSESNFVSIDMASGKVQLIASCQREQKLTPLDNMIGARFVLMPPSPNSKSLMMSVVGARSNIFFPTHPQNNIEETRNGIWEYNLEDSTFKQIPLPWDGDGQKYGLTVYGPDPIALRRHDTRTGQFKWFLFDSITRTPEEMLSTTVLNGFRPLWCSKSANWWHRDYAGTGHRQDLAIGKLTEFRVAVEGNATVDKVMFHQDENTAIIQMGTRLWIARDFHLKPE